MSTPPTTNETPLPDPPSRLLDGGDAVDGDTVDRNAEFELLGNEIDADDSPDLFPESQPELPSFVAGSGFEAVRSGDFQRIGVEEHETRVIAIRNAARRTTAAIWTSTQPDPSSQVAELTWTTYRLIDPRFRNSPFQQIRVGRILPLVLSYAACMDLIPTNEPFASDPTPSLFGRRMPVVVPPVARAQQPAADSNRKPPRYPKKGDVVAPVDTEAMQTLTELRSFSASSMWRTLVHDERFLIGLIAITSSAAVILMIFAVRFSMSMPEAMTQKTIARPPSERPQDSAIVKAELPPEPLLLSSEPATAQESILASEPAPTETDELFAALANAIERGKAELKKQLHDLSSESDETMPLVEKASSPLEKPTFSSADVETAANTLWRNTPSAARQFTGATASTLIDQWDFEAELSGFGTLEHAAASHLSLQAAWLAEPLSNIISRLRDNGPVLDAEVTKADQAQSFPNDPVCCHLPFDELTRLIESWQAARKRVVITDDLNQMLHQGTVLVDRILVSDRLQPDERTDLIQPLLVDVTRLASLAKDETLIAEFQQIIEAMGSFPDASQWTRMEDADDVSGFLGRVRCLKQRQWREGLSSLTKTTEPALASCAKAEWEWQQTPTATVDKRVEIAERWSKIALRLPAREAASVRLHALELYGNSPQHAEERQQLLMALPSYVAPLAQL